MATGLTRERWLLILFQELGYGRLHPAKGLEAGGKSFAISHYWLNTPIHLIGFRVDLDKRPPTQARRSFTSFLTVVEQYPNSEYAHDSRKRMVYLRNRLADYEIAVARYYLGRGAYVAAAQRAKVSIEEFDGAPAVCQSSTGIGEGSCWNRLTGPHAGVLPGCGPAASPHELCEPPALGNLEAVALPIGGDLAVR